jgi:hypothetical protein
MTADATMVPNATATTKRAATFILAAETGSK